jgi:choline dehydrogenase-like flavoprotein
MPYSNLSKALVTPLTRVAAHPPDVVIVGSGPSGVAVAECLYNVFPDVTMAVLERGDILTLTHVGNISSDTDPRGRFIGAHGAHPYKGYFEKDGMMMFALGGRGIVAGGHLRRFDKDDYNAWDNGRWPVSPSDLAPFFTVAEMVRRVATGECQSPAQTWVMGALDSFNPHPPPWGVDVRSPGAKRGLDSSAQRLCELIQHDSLEAFHNKRPRRLVVSTNAQVTNLELKNDRVIGLKCKDLRTGKPVNVAGALVVLAASPIESASLVLSSTLRSGRVFSDVIGRYLAEHLPCSAEVPLPERHARECVSVVVPPLGQQKSERFQIDVKTATVKGGRGGNVLRIFGFAAMDPKRNNRVVVNRDGQINTILKPTRLDRARVAAMCGRMREVASKLDAGSDIRISGPLWGRSNHEVGTLRMGPKPDGKNGSESVTNYLGQVHDVENLFVADASVFPCVGIANPMLTTTALAYRLAHHLGEQLRRKPNLIEPWSICTGHGRKISRTASAGLNP